VAATGALSQHRPSHIPLLGPDRDGSAQEREGGLGLRYPPLRSRRAGPLRWRWRRDVHACHRAASICRSRRSCHLWAYTDDCHATCGQRPAAAPSKLKKRFASSRGYSLGRFDGQHVGTERARGPQAGHRRAAVAAERPCLWPGPGSQRQGPRRRPDERWHVVARRTSWWWRRQRRCGRLRPHR
jgi:hypothetical protein